MEVIMKFRKIIVISIISALFISIFSFPVFAINQIEMSGMSEVIHKTTFVSEAQKKHMATVTLGMGVPPTVTEIDTIIQFYSFAQTAKEKQSAETAMDAMGLFVYYDNNVTPLDSQAVTPASIWYPDSNNTDVCLNNPIIVYNSWTDTWIVSVSGYWLNDAYMPYIITKGSVGNPEAFGFGFTNIRNTYESSVIRSNATIWDQYREKSVTTTNRADGNGALGCGFRLQDEIVILPEHIDNLYIGAYWYASCTYDSNFATYSAVVTAYYTHTYDSMTIDSIEFGVQGKEAGVNITFSKGEDDGFTTYSSGDAITPGYTS